MLVEDPCLQRAARTKQRIATVQKVRQDKREFDLEFVAQCLGILSNQILTRSSSTSTTFSDPVIMCLDTEGWVRELGLCILDTRDLKILNYGSDLSSVLCSYNYILYKKLKTEKERPFKYGTSQRLNQRWTAWLLGKVLRTGSPDPARVEERNVILVGHSIMSDLRALASCYRGKFDITNFPDVPLINTINLVREVWPLKSVYTPSLAQAAEWLGLEKRYMIWHNAGNDANATIKVLLSLALMKSRESRLTNEQEERAKLLQGVIKASCPSRPTDVD